MMGQALVTIGARLMSWVVRRRLHLLLMAGAAQARRLRCAQKLMGRVTLGTRKVFAAVAALLVRLSVAAAARGTPIVRLALRARRWMDVVTTGAWSGHAGQDRMIGFLLLVAARASLLSRCFHVVRSVTIGTRRMCGHPRRA